MLLTTLAFAQGIANVMNNLNYPANSQQSNSASNTNVGNIKSWEINKERCNEIDNIPLCNAIV